MRAHDFRWVGFPCGNFASLAIYREVADVLVKSMCECVLVRVLVRVAVEQVV